MSDARVATTLDLRAVAIDHPHAQLLVEEVQEIYVALYGGRDESPIDVAEFVAPLGSFWVGYLDGDPLVSGAWRRRNDVLALGSTVSAEIKRMYVAPRGRGLGLARAMLAHLEATAAEGGAEVMILETGVAQPEAMALYESVGYQPITPYGHYAWSPSNRCYARRLVTDQRGRCSACLADTPMNE